jgi:DNA-binding NarL/FixJ family response regulator
VKVTTETKMIVVWGSKDIFSSSIQHLLATREDWKVVSVLNREELDSLILSVKDTCPDIVILRQGDHDFPSNIPLELLQDHPTIKVVVISLENNLIDIYNKQKILIKDSSDLITAIENVA